MQTWKIKGKDYTREQLQELKRQGLDPRKDNIVMKFISGDQATKSEEVKESGHVEEAKGSSAVKVELETEEQEFERLKNERAWVNKDKKDRYNELKTKFTAEIKTTV